MSNQFPFGLQFFVNRLYMRIVIVFSVFKNNMNYFLKLTYKWVTCNLINAHMKCFLQVHRPIIIIIDTPLVNNFIQFIDILISDFIKYKISNS